MSACHLNTRLGAPSFPDIDSRITYLQKKLLVATLVKEKRITHRENLDTSLRRCDMQKKMASTASSKFDDYCSKHFLNSLY